MQSIEELYFLLLRHWNNRDAGAFAELFSDDGNAVGFDGTSMNGSDGIRAALGEVFAHHATAAYTGIVREVRMMGDNTCLLRAVAGMVPPGHNKIKEQVNAVQSLVFERKENGWRIALLQNTPAAYHGQPERQRALTEELQAAFDRPSVNKKG